MIVISYSAEGVSFSDRDTYPYFFRTIGENSQYEDVYLNFLKKMKWARVASLTEDGYKHTEYISHMENTLKQNNIVPINKKFLSTVSVSEMQQVLKELKAARAKIIVADIQDHIAQVVLCEAYKLKVCFSSIFL
jgi:ABC-type branched-subunit amino acid transport system substrate-binding protein